MRSGEDGMAMLKDEPRVHFDAVLRPHRSLTRGGFALLMAAWLALNAGVAFYFYRHGAWPVVGFFGLDVALLYLAFELNYRGARQMERVRLTDDALEVVRITPAGKTRAWRFQPYWLRVSIDDPPSPESPLTLRSHGRELAIASFLSPEERLSLAEALKSALARHRAPPQTDRP
jgi:uncharacterized membrane protein